MQETKDQSKEMAAERAFTVNLPEDMHTQVRIEAIRRKMTLKEFIREAVRKMLES